MFNKHLKKDKTTKGIYPYIFNKEKTCLNLKR